MNSHLGFLITLVVLITAAPVQQGVSQVIAPAAAASKMTPIGQVPVVVNTPLAPAHIDSGGASSPMQCRVDDTVSVVIINDTKVEVHDCEDGQVGGGGGAGAGAGSGVGGGGAFPTSPSGNGTPTEDCQLFIQSLQNSCAGLPQPVRALCQYNACVAGAKCLGQGSTQCGSKPKSVSTVNTTVCFNSYAANFNACTTQFKTPGGQNSCLFAASKSLNACVPDSSH
jgi:hypothetical protein